MLIRRTWYYMYISEHVLHKDTIHLVKQHCAVIVVCLVLHFTFSRSPNDILQTQRSR